MLFLISVLAAAAGASVLLTVLMRLRGRARWLSDTMRGSRDHIAHRVGTLAARIAALRVALSRRRR